MHSGKVFMISIFNLQILTCFAIVVASNSLLYNWKVSKIAKIDCKFSPTNFATTHRLKLHKVLSHSRPEDLGLNNGLNQTEMLPNNEKFKVIAPLAIAGIGAALFSLSQYVDIASILERSISTIKELGPLGYVYFAIVYIITELLAIPAMPLTASSGYLFGLIPGMLIVMTSATIAAGISFFIGRTFLYTWAQDFIKSSPKWRAVDKAIAKEGFKVVLLLRLSPLLPFALSNYLYAVTSVDFPSFIAATFLGFAPGTFGVVYFGSAGKALIDSGLNAFNLPWYIYLAVGGGLILFGKTITKIASDIIADVEKSEEKL